MMYVKREGYDQFYEIDYIVKKSKNNNLIAYPQKIVEVSKSTYYRQPEDRRLILMVPTQPLHQIGNLANIQKIVNGMSFNA